MRYLKSIFVCLFLFFTAGCASASSKISVMSNNIANCCNQQRIKTIAIPAGLGVLGDAIAVELSNHGYQIFDPQQTSNLFIRANLSETEISQQQNLRSLKEIGIDAYLSIRSVDGFDGRPESASVRLTSTSDGRIIAGISWQNGWGGIRGSPYDRSMRKNVSEAAAEITMGLIHGRP